MKKLITLLAAFLLAISAAPSMALPISISTYSPVLIVSGATIGTGTGDLIDGVLTFDLVYEIELAGLGTATLTTYGTLYDGVPPTGTSAATECTGIALVCDPIDFDVLSELTFISGGPFSTTGETVFATGPSSSGNSGPTTWTLNVVPVPATIWLLGSVLVLYQFKSPLRSF